MGESDVAADGAEVYDYANALAVTNGFNALPVRGKANNAGRNPNLVFPGDRLKLPDGRVMPIKQGQSIWEVADKQYRKDFARLKILDVQFEDGWKKKRVRV